MTLTLILLLTSMEPRYKLYTLTLSSPEQELAYERIAAKSIEHAVEYYKKTQGHLGWTVDKVEFNHDLEVADKFTPRLRRLTPESVARRIRIAELRQDGWSFGKIAKSLGITRQAVHQIYHRS